MSRCMCLLLFFFFKQKTAYEMRISDWSSDVCSSDLARLRFRPIIMTSLAFSFGVLPLAIATGASAASQNAIGTGVLGGKISATVLAIFFVPAFFVVVMTRSDERRVGRECVSKCRYRWSASH